MRGSDGAQRLLEEFRDDFPEAPELDELAVALAVYLEANGDEVGARTLLAGVDGPRSALERGYLHLASGDVEQGKTTLRESVAGLAPREATQVIALLELLDRLQGDASPIVTASVLAHRGSSELALVELERALGDVADEDRPAVLALAARIAGDGGLPERAARFRARLIQDFPRAPEVAEATLRLARFRAASAEGVEEAIQLLESLILSEPNGAIVPTARRELRTLRGGRGS
jgi:tetratricopeptide (TPR) repeat protein